MSAPIIRYPDGTETILSGPIGTVIISPVATPPAHTLECNGAAISRAVYAKLFAVLGTQYGDGDGTTTFNVPNIDGVVYGTAAERTVGTQLVEGLPNINGTLNAWHTYGNSTANDTSWNGALYQKNTRDNAQSWNGSCIGGTQMLNSIVLDASLSNATYGAADRVQPKGIVMKYCIIFE